MPPRPPSLLEMVRNFLGASAREGAAVLRGDPEMPAAEIARRRAICHACGRYVAASDLCLACGCGVTKKTGWRTASCPEGHWSALEPVVVPPRS